MRHIVAQALHDRTTFPPVTLCGVQFRTYAAAYGDDWTEKDPDPGECPRCAAREAAIRLGVLVLVCHVCKGEGWLDRHAGSGCGKPQDTCYQCEGHRLVTHDPALGSGVTSIVPLRPEAFA